MVSNDLLDVLIYWVIKGLQSKVMKNLQMMHIHEQKLLYNANSEQKYISLWEK